VEILDIALLLLGAKVFGSLFNKLKQPSLGGELLGGIILGSSVLGIVKSSALVNATSQFGLMFLVLLTSLAIDWKKIESKAEKLSLMELIIASLTFVVSYFVGGIFNFSFYTKVVFGFALMQSSTAIVARALSDIGEFNSREGEAIISLQIIDDIAAILCVAILANFLQNSTIGLEPIMKTLFIAVGFFVVISKTGARFIHWIMNSVQKYGMEEALFAVTLVIAFLLSSFTEQFGIASFLGMFLTGILISKTPQAGIVSQKVKEVGETFFIPIFFATIGLSVSISSVYQQLPILIPLIVSIIAIKLVCASLPLTLFGYSWKESLRIGSGMVSLSEMAVVILGIGLSSQALDVTLYSMLAVAFIIIDTISPLILNFAFKYRR